MNLKNFGYSPSLPAPPHPAPQNRLRRRPRPHPRNSGPHNCRLRRPNPEEVHLRKIKYILSTTIEIKKKNKGIMNEITSLPESSTTTTTSSFFLSVETSSFLSVETSSFLSVETSSSSLLSVLTVTSSSSSIRESVAKSFGKSWVDIVVSFRFVEKIETSTRKQCFTKSDAIIWFGLAQGSRFFVRLRR